MLFLLFQLGKDLYALEAGQVVEVLPLVEITQIPQSPRGVAGMFNHRGEPVPVIDLSELTLGQSAARRFSTRMILVHYADEKEGQHLLALIAEKATQTLHRDAKDFVASGVTNDQASYLGPVATDRRGLIQWIKVNQLLPPSVRDVLFKQPARNP
jgi:chemotaxis-related protein WspB